MGLRSFPPCGFIIGVQRPAYLLFVQCPVVVQVADGHVVIFHLFAFVLGNTEFLGVGQQVRRQAAGSRRWIPGTSHAAT